MPTINVQRSITINAPKDDIYNVLSDFRKWPFWSPWLIVEPGAELSYKDEGNWYKWKGDIVGEGEMTIIEKAENHIFYDLMFLKPWKSFAKVKFILEKEGDAIKVTWTMDSKLPFFLFWMVKQTEAFIGLDYERGLRMLEEYVLTGEVQSSLTLNGGTQLPSQQYVAIRNTCSFDTIDKSMHKDAELLEAFAKKHDIKGKWFSLYHTWDMINRSTEYSFCIPMDIIPEDLPSNFVSGTRAKLNTYSVTHKGYYKHLGNAYAAGMMKVRADKKFKFLKKEHMVEIYDNDPSQVEEKNLLSTIHIPVK